jgi:hypothetical protein
MKQPHVDEFELTVADTPGPAARPGFHETRTRTFYVTAAGSVYLLAAPGQRAMLQAVEHLPPYATPSPRVRDLRLWTLANVAEDLAAQREPKKCELYEMTSETGEVLSRSSSTLAVGESSASRSQVHNPRCLRRCWC